MKAIATSLFVFLFVMSSLAQSSDHLTFKGVPIDGTLREFVSKMQQNGFTLQKLERGFALMNGDFAAYKDCNIGVSTLQQKDLVNKVVVMFSDYDTWSALYGNYSNLKDLLIKKYGQPSTCVEKFDSYSEPDDDGDRMHAVMMDNCKYYTSFETDKGIIKLSIKHTSVLSCYVMLAYYDALNSEIIRNAALNDL